MVSLSRESFAGLDCVRLENDSLSLWATTGVGPRILGLALHGEENLFAVLPGITLDCPGVGAYHFYGGHRLWYAPEDPRRTYLPDDQDVEVDQTADGVRLTQPTHPETGIQKQITIRLQAAGARVVVEHTLYNRGRMAVELAPWAITQLRTGGLAIVPLAAPAADDFKVLPNRSIALWPYTDLSSPHVQIGKQLLRVAATMDRGDFKVGLPNPAGWLAYLVGRTLFIKYVPYHAGADYFDLGSSSECYCNARFIELESLGPRAMLPAGNFASHAENWELVGDVTLPAGEGDLVEALKRLGLSFPGGAL
jgi:hypothetical protein